MLFVNNLHASVSFYLACGEYQENRFKNVFGQNHFHLSCRIAGYKSVSGRSCHRPQRHRFFLISLRLKANAEMVPKTPICFCMLLI